MHTDMEGHFVWDSQCPQAGTGNGFNWSYLQVSKQKHVGLILLAQTAADIPVFISTFFGKINEKKCVQQDKAMLGMHSLTVECQRYTLLTIYNICNN